MENRNLAIALTVATILLCGLPGLVSVCVSALIVIDGPFPDQPELEWLLGILILCIGLLFILIPVGVGFFSLRRKKRTEPITPSDEPIPPPS